MIDHGSLANALLCNAPPRVRPAEAVALVERHYGLNVSVEALGGERDTNYHARTSDGHGYILKFANQSETPLVTNLTTAAMLHIAERDPSLPIQRLIAACNGEHEPCLAIEDGEPTITRLFTWLDGMPLWRAERSAVQRAAIAALLARLDLALADFEHPAAAGHELLWDIKHVDRLRPLIEAIADPARRDLLQALLERHQSTVAPQVAKMRAQLIHNDLNPHNLLVDPRDQQRVTGILDFGDAVHTPLIHELAVACSYQIDEDDGHPLEAVGQFVRAYHRVLPLRPEELEALFDLIKARLATTVIITSWRAQRHPENDTYILRNNPPAWRALERLGEISPQAAHAYLACALGERT
ncbi:phosphotransferase [Halotalea alkalilenta]|uniref:phosphotransferase n=1 Tax=Halotalea alkalilenta TaxID=376489 RepID=UPI000693EC25|nr:phosphotransferase [Halotalea alkalilenta]